MPPYGTTGHWSELPPHHGLLTAPHAASAFRQGSYADQPIYLILPLVWYAQARDGAPRGLARRCWSAAAAALARR